MAYFIDGVYDCGRVFPSECQGDFPVLPDINEIRYLLMIDRFEVSGEVFPLFEDSFLCRDRLVIETRWR